MQKEYSRISPTAIFCARMRAKQNLPFSKEIIDLIDTKYASFIEDLPDYGNTLKSKSDFIPFIEGRYHSLNEVLSKIGNAFIVEIASGLSPRSLKFLKKKGYVYVETDLERLIKLKEQILREIVDKKNLCIKNLFFMSINPLKKGDMDKIGQFYLEKRQKKKLIIIHEGLLMYFNKEEKRIFRDNIKYLFEKYAKEGVWLTSDFSRLKKKSNERKGGENIRHEISKVTKREFDYFESEGDTKKFLIDGGFKIKIISNKSLVEKLIEKKSLRHKRRKILDSAKGYRIWELKLL